jgi:tetratricopeptide (TPR) repeat protein
LGFAVHLSIYIFKYNKKIWLTFASAFFLVLVTVALAIFKIGPLQSFIYKDSLAVRQYYWLAGWEMFKQNPMAGVGIDHYGLYFKEYRQVGYPLSYGWDITSSNAHNVPIQMFATGGLFLGLLYLMIQLIVLSRAIKLIKNSTGVKQSISTLLFAIWLAYQAQSLFSIEMIGISIWGWVLGGSIVGLSMQDENQEVKKSRHSVELNTKRLLLVTAFMIALLTIIVPMRQAEKVTFQLQFDVGADKAQQIKNFNESFNELFNNNFVSTDYKNIGIYRALNLGENLKAIAELEKLIVKNARNLDTLGLLVEAYEKTGDFNSAIFYRNQISKYDPWNAKNYLGLAQLYKQVGNYSDMTRMVQKILSFAPNDPIALVAQKEFPPIAN